MGGVNYFLPDPAVSLSRLRSVVGTWRYASDVVGNLYRRAGDTQGPYTVIATGLSGAPFSSVVNTCYNSSTPYLFIADAAKMLKDSGTGSPTRIGILPPNTIANITPNASKFLAIDNFVEALGSYTLVNVTGWSSVPIGNVVSGGAAMAVNNFVSFSIASGIGTAFNGAVAHVSGNSGTATLARMFDVYGAPQVDQLAAVGINGTLTNVGATTFALNSYQGTVAANTVGTIARNGVFLDLTQDNQVTDDDLIVLTMMVSDPQNIEEIRVVFILNDSDGDYAYYYKSITPVYYQSGVQNQTDPFQTTLNQVFWQTGSQISTKAKPVDFPVGAPGGVGGTVGQITPVNFSTGAGSWVAVYMRRGDFLPVGAAGQENYTWANVAGWRVQITTNDQGSCDVALNGLYLQWGYGPSSYGGIGYDYRYTYYNINTGTESNGSQLQYSSEQFGTASSLAPLIVLRQAIIVVGDYSTDPQVTHVRIYRRGGTLGEDWLLVDQVPNSLSIPSFLYTDIIPDASLVQASTLKLDNDAPVTSSLRVPISTFLASPVGGSGPNVYDGFGPVLITVTNGSTQFLQNQILVIGTPQNLEQVPVESPGVGSCHVTLRLQHAAGEPVQAFSIPAQAVDLIELAYGQLWWAGDPNNPHYLYYSKPGYPENVGPQNYIQVSQPSDPIMAVINFRGTLFVATLTTWYQIIGGQTPYAQPTGSKHGLVAKQGWARTESAIFYQAIDGIREFRGADGAYISLPVEWLFREVDFGGPTPIPTADLSNIALSSIAFYDNFVYLAYPTTLYPNSVGGNSRLIYSTSYNRFRNDTIAATCQFYEADTNNLLYCRYVPPPTGPGYAICIDQQGDTDDMGWDPTHVLIQQSVAFTVQIPYQDLGKPHFPKQWNMLEVDADVDEGEIDVTVAFDDGASFDLGTLPSLVGRQKYELQINNGLGYEAYSMSVIISGSGALGGAPTLFQLNIYAAVLAASRNSFDTYWIKFNTDESKLIKEGYFDYTSGTPITVSLYADGATDPYFAFTLPVNQQRSQVPQRVRFPAVKCRLWRLVATSTSELNRTAFQFWTAPQVSWKPASTGSGYARAELTT